MSRPRRSEEDARARRSDRPASCTTGPGSSDWPERPWASWSGLGGGIDQGLDEHRGAVDATHDAGRELDAGELFDHEHELHVGERVPSVRVGPEKVLSGG